MNSILKKIYLTKLHGSNYNGVTKETKTLKEVKA